METATSFVIFGQSSVSVPVFIINDDLFETPENFFGLLSSGSELPPNIQLAPTQATATILDGVGKCETVIERLPYSRKHLWVLIFRTN